MRSTISRLLIIGGAITAATLLYFFADPSQTPWMPRCIFLSVTGLQCPGCGAQRMVHALLHGDIAAAWSYNAFLLLMLPLILLMMLAEAGRKHHPTFYARLHSVAMIIAVGVTILAWFIIRNFIL